MMSALLAPSFSGQNGAKAQTPGKFKVSINELVQYSRMHEVIGMQKHEARGVLAELLSAFLARHAGKPEASQVVEMERHEAELYRRFANWFSYGFYVARKR